MKNLTSLETRRTIKQMAEQGVKSPEIAAQLGVSIGTVRKWRQRLQKGGLCTQLWDALLAEMY
jgi:transposase